MTKHRDEKDDNNNVFGSRIRGFGDMKGSCFCQPSAIEAKEFRKKWSLLSKKERYEALKSNYNQFMRTSVELLPCLGCRNSTESLLHRLSESPSASTLVLNSGLRIGEDLSITLDEAYLDDPEASLGLFSKHERWGNSSAAKLGRSSRSNNRARCFLHSQRARTGPRPAAFNTMWKKIHEDHRQRLSQIDADQFLADLECYLRRHRFCCRCKEKVLEAYDLLIGTSCSDDDCEECAGYEYLEKHDEYGEELQYTSYLFDELSFCRGSGQIIVPCHIEFMSQLMTRANEELVGDWGDRHARTIAEAQDEVLTCLGMVIWDKLQNMWTKSRSDKRSEELLIYLGIASIRKTFEIAVEALHGQEIVDKLLAEEDDETRRIARKREKRKERKKKRRNANKMKTGIEDMTPRPNIDHGGCDCTDIRSNDIIHQSTHSDHDTIHNNRIIKPLSCIQNELEKNASADLLPQKIDLNISQSSNIEGDSSLRKLLDDETAEMQLLSSMGWIAMDKQTPEDDEFIRNEIPEHEIKTWKRNQANIVSQRKEQRQKLQERFDQFVLRSTQ